MRIIIIIEACSNSSDTKKVKNHPREYYNKEIIIEGNVGEQYSLIVFKYFPLIHSTDTLFVITEKPLPRIGEKIKVTGKVVCYSFLDKELLALKEL